MKYIKYIVQAALGLALSVGVMYYRGLFEAQSGADKIMIISDGFTVTALLFLSMGILVWISTTGFFDIFGYAFRKGAHALIPGLGAGDKLTGFYEYKLKKQEERETKEKGEKSMLLVGAVFLLAGIVATFFWYRQ